MSGRAFPSLPDFAARWVAVYWEPIPNSGESLTIAIAAESNAEWNVVPTIDSDLGGRLVTSPLKLLAPIELVIDSIRIHLKSGKALESWQSPVSGFKTSKVKTTRAADLSTAIRLAMMDTAVFSKITEEIIQTSEQAESISDDDSKWPRLVEQAVVSIAPSYLRFFRKRLKLKEGARETPLDFVGNKYVANFARILPNTSISYHVNAAKVKLLNLESFRSYSARESLFSSAFNKPNFELLVYRPSDDDPGYSDNALKKLQEAFTELEDFADRHEMRIEAFQTPQNAAMRLIEKEAA
jgi:hypothetical protein